MGMWIIWGPKRFAHPSEWEGKKKNPNGTILVLPARYWLLLLGHVEKGCSCGWWKWPGTKQSKAMPGCTLASHKATCGHFHKGKFRCALPLSLKYRGTKTEGLLQDHLSPLQRPPQYLHESRAGPDVKAACGFKVELWDFFYPGSQGTLRLFQVQITLWICCTDWAPGWMGASKNRPFCSSEATSPNDFPAKRDCWI